MALLELHGVRAGYGPLSVLFDVDLTVDEGEWVTVVGANGSGRSTLLKTILGATGVSQGEVIFRGDRITHLAPHRRVAAGIALSPEGRQVFANLSVKENLVSGANNLRTKDVSDALAYVYGVFPKLEARAKQRAGSLSGGEAQMLAVGRALMSRPRLLLIDELSLGLAPIIVDNLVESLEKLCQQGLAVIVVDQVHVHRAMAGQSGRRLVLEKGRFVSSDSRETEAILSV